MINDLSYFRSWTISMVFFDTMYPTCCSLDIRYRLSRHTHSGLLYHIKSRCLRPLTPNVNKRHHTPLKDKYPNFEVGLKCILTVNPYLLVCSYIK